jgi:NAD+ kinase
VNVLVLLKLSSYRKYVEEEHDKRVEALIESKDPTVRRWLPGHRDHCETVEEVKAVLDGLGVHATYEEDPRTSTRDGERFDLVMTVGGDGTLLAASHQIGPGVPLLGVNSAPEHSVGFFCAARKGAVKQTVTAALEGTLRRVVLARMRVDLNDICLHRRVLNEALFCHQSPAATSRYILSIGEEEEEEQKSSGMWIGPAAGSTAAQRSAGGKVLPLSSQKIQYVVREPYVPLGERMKMTLGTIEETKKLTLRSKMRQAKIFLDGDHTVYDVSIGDVITMQRSDEPLLVLGLTRNGRHKNG